MFRGFVWMEIIKEMLKGHWRRSCTCSPFIDVAMRFKGIEGFPNFTHYVSYRVETRILFSQIVLVKLRQ